MPSSTVERFKKARNDAAAELAADYLEMIVDLTEECGEARATDLATRMGVSHVTVSKALQRLQRDGYVRYRPYRSIFVTEEGSRIAQSAKENHVTVLDFLLKIGVPEEVAQIDAEGLEHHISPETLGALRKFLAVQP